MRKSKPIRLPEDEQARLEKYISSGEHKARHIGHAQIILRAAEGWTDDKIAAAIGVSAKTVLTVRHRYQAEGLEAVLRDKPRSGAPRKIDGAVRAVVVATTCSKAPEGHVRWTMRLLADKMVELELVDNISPETIRQILKKTN
jgi:transposase